MDKTYGTIYYVDKHYYEALCGVDLSNEDIVLALKYPMDRPDSKMSPFTRYILAYVNGRAQEIFSTPWYHEYITNSIFSETDKASIISAGNAILKSSRLLDYDEPSTEKYYELTSLPNGDILVIMQDGFITHLTESKDNYKQFILDCLCIQYKFNTDSSYLLYCYLNLRIIPDYLETVKLRFE